jgi:hypothetical protein
MHHKVFSRTTSSLSANPVHFRAGMTGKDFQEQAGQKRGAPETAILDSKTHQAEK